ncbi:unnamed protein product [Bemisia tabaci]|uniref:Uncharacterized protein n=1 Tax=Bemisia tabaci TaxID=7038 RepID=A0A9P0F3R7_BEMTA|nr:unnamed protein product [Bemisia tabaci]
MEKRPNINESLIPKGSPGFIHNEYIHKLKDKLTKINKELHKVTFATLNGLVINGMSEEDIISLLLKQVRPPPPPPPPASSTAPQGWGYVGGSSCWPQPVNVNPVGWPQRDTLQLFIMTEKKFAIVKFPEEDDAVDIIPTAWLHDDELYCYYPKMKTNEERNNLVRRCIEADEESWDEKLEIEKKRQKRRNFFRTERFKLDRYFLTNKSLNKIAGFPAGSSAWIRVHMDDTNSRSLVTGF